MSRYVLTPQASRDLEDIVDYIAKVNVGAAAELIRTIEDKCQLLAQFPDIGSRCEDLAPGLRSFSVGKYVIFYRPVSYGMEVIRVLHGARDFPVLFQS